MYYKQETDWSCGASSLRNALSNLGVEINEEDLVKLLKTNERRGTHAEMFQNIRELNLDFFIKENVSVTEVKEFQNKGYQIITGFYVLDEFVDHYTLIKKIKNNEIIMQDPWFGDNYNMSLERFESVWYLDPKYEDKKRWIVGIRNN